MRLNKNYHPKHTPICHLYFLSILSTKNHRISTRLLFFLHFSISNRSDVTSRYPFAISSSRSHLPRAKSISRKQYPVAIPLFHAIRSENDRVVERTWNDALFSRSEKIEGRGNIPLVAPESSYVFTEAWTARASSPLMKISKLEAHRESVISRGRR